jgi:hypothetical protein
MYDAILFQNMNMPTASSSTVSQRSAPGPGYSTSTFGGGGGESPMDLEYGKDIEDGKRAGFMNPIYDGGRRKNSLSPPQQE